MVHGMFGSFQTPNPENNSSSKAGKSVPSKDELEKNPSLCMRNHVNSVPLLPSGLRSCSDRTCLSCLSFPGQSLSPKAKIQKLRAGSYGSKCLDFHNTGTCGFPALSFSCKKSTRKSRPHVKGTNGGIAWMTLPGLLDGEDDIDLNGIVRLTEQRETAVWNGFAPFQKVLIVAVTAAAATAAKQKYSKEMRNLQRAIDTRDRDLENLREKIGQLQEHLSFWKEQAQSFCVEAKDAEIIDRMFSHGNASPDLLKVGLESTPKCDAGMLEQYDTPQIGNVLRKMPERVACFRRNMRASNFKKGISRFGDTTPKERSDEETHEIRTFLDRLSESPSFTGGLLGALIPESPSNSFSSIRTSQLNFKNASPAEDDCQKGFERRAEDPLMSTSVPYALVLQLKAVMREFLNNETPEVLIALTSLKEKVQMLEPTASGQTDLLQSCHTQADITSLKENIDQALTKLNLLQHTIGGVLDVLLEDPQSNVSFSHKKGQISTSQDMLEKVGTLTDVDQMMISTSTSTKGQQADQTQVNLPVVQFLINSTIDTLVTSISGRGQCDTDIWSSEMVIEQLLGELESAATKVASMETQIKVLKESRRNGDKIFLNQNAGNQSRQLQLEEVAGEEFRQNEQSTCPTCKELNLKVRFLEEAQKRLAASREACKEKERSISMLEGEIAALQKTVSDLKSIQVTPKVVTSNMLFNLDSPVKSDSPHRGARSPFSSWQGLHEFSRESSSLDRRSMRESCDGDMCRSDGGNHVPFTKDYNNNLACMPQAAENGMCRSDGEDDIPHSEDERNDSAHMQQAANMYRSDGSHNVSCNRGYKDESGCLLQAAKDISYSAVTMVQEIRKEYRMDPSGEEEAVCRSCSSTDEWSRKSSTSSTRSSSDNSSSGSVRSARLPRPPRSYASHAKKLKFAKSADLRYSEDSNGNMPSETVAALRRDRGILLNNKASNVLAGVEPNTPMRDRKFGGGSKEKHWGAHSLDDLTKAKENFSHRRRWR